MTVDVSPLSARARALAARCEGRVNELARQITRDDFAVLSGYDGLPEDMKHTEMAATVRYGLRLFFTVVREGRPGRSEEFRPFRERAAQRAEEGWPLHLLLRTHLVGRHALFRALREEARPGEEPALAELADLLLGSSAPQVGAIAETYQTEQSALLAERREQRRTLARALLAGYPVLPGRLEEAGLGRGALVLAFGLDSIRASDAPGGTARAANAETSPAVALGRRLRRVQTVLERAFGAEVLVVAEPEGGHALVPAEVFGPGGVSVAQVPADLPARLSRICGAEVWLAATPAADAAGIAAAGRTAGEVLRLVRALGRAPGLYRLDDVLLEYHLSRGGEASGALAGLLDPLADRPELLATLRAYLAQQQDRRATARELGLHPNTVDNRLARVGELIGVDVTAPRGYALTLTALTLRELGGPA
ncbi:PucR family transcriptional regulator [Streptacidiphilus pinicola]|uniref:PucR family transcriptional regulator n=1 Tax=Streptacidiphilus pinicola TaxID=2219663 RepID=A0A2X0JB02_9ACTN|nr:PucR family transcriptional regulator [Streptacidiphilus pinicola]RAG84718.1 PucR family transcriptional regulator [Streptacidiphilus pinicola]